MNVFHALPGCFPGISATDAYRNGYKHGYQNIVTRGICNLPADGAEHRAWQEGYTRGEHDFSAAIAANPEPPALP